VVAVARKLAVLLHLLWVTGEVYEPLRNSKIGQEGGIRKEGGLSLVFANRRVRVTARSWRNERCWNRNVQFDAEMAAPDTRMRTPTGTGASRSTRVRMEAGRVGGLGTGTGTDAGHLVRLPLVGDGLYRLAGETESPKGRLKS
jgi:hypothetical protein